MRRKDERQTDEQRDERRIFPPTPPSPRREGTSSSPIRNKGYRVEFRIPAGKDGIDPKRVEVVIDEGQGSQ